MMMGDVKIEGPEESVWEEVAKAAGEMADMVSEASSSSGWGLRRHRLQERQQHAHSEATSSSWHRLQSSPEVAAGLHTTRPLSSLEGSSVLDGKPAASGLEPAMPHGRPIANRFVPSSHGKPPMYPEPASLSSQSRPSANAETMVSMTHVSEPATAAVPLDERSPGADLYGAIAAPVGEENEETLGMSSHQIKRMRRSAQHAQRAASQARGGSGDWSSDSPAFRTLHAILDIVGALEKHHQEIDILDKAFIAYEKVSKGALPSADLHLHELQYMKARAVHVQAFTDQHQVLQELLTSSGLEEKDWPQIAREGCALIESRAGPLPPLSPQPSSTFQLQQQSQPCIPLSPDSTVVATLKELTAARPHEVSPCTPPAVQDSSLAPTTPCINIEHAASASRPSPSAEQPSQDNNVPKLQAASGVLDVPVVMTAAVSSGQPESVASALHQLPAVDVYKDKEQSELALSKLGVQAMLTALSLQGTEGRENFKREWVGDDPVSPNAMWTVGASPSPPKVSPASNCCRSPPSASRVEGIQHGGLDKDGYSIPPFDPQALFQAASSVVPLDPKCPLHTRQGLMQPCRTTTKPSLVVDLHSDALRQCTCGVGSKEWSEWSTEGDKHIQHQQQKQLESPFQLDKVAPTVVCNANAKASLPSEKQHACSPLFPPHSASAVQGVDSGNGALLGNVKERGNEEKKNWFHTAVGGLGGSLHNSLRALATCLVIMHVAGVVSARDTHSQNQNQKRR